ncbi:MAG: hypothetical protein AAGJ08_29455 [Cyanobacteria bacterium P01_H01_bin.35]
MRQQQPSPGHSREKNRLQQADNSLKAPQERVSLLIPKPPISREKLSVGVQRIWAQTEIIIAVRPPKPPACDSVGSIADWMQESFSPWVNKRYTSVKKLEKSLQGKKSIAQLSLEEKGFGTGLFAYIYDNTLSAIDSIPIPRIIAEDEEAMMVYMRGLRTKIRPVLTATISLYHDCKQFFFYDRDPAWLRWGQYCEQRENSLRAKFKFVLDDEPSETQKESVEELDIYRGLDGSILLPD